MVKNWLFILFLLTFHSLLTAQDKEADFEQLVDKAVKKMYQSPDDCINFTQSLSISNQNAEHRMILQNLMAQALAMKGDYVQSVKFSLEEDNTRSGIPASSFTTLFLNYNLAEQYQNLRLYTQSAKIIRNSLQNIRETQLSTTPKGSVTIAKLYQLSAINMAITKDYSNALKTFETSDKFLKFSNNENHIIHIENELYRVGIRYNQGQLPEAKKIVTKVLAQMSGSDIYFLYSLAHEIDARLCFAEGRYREAVQHLDTAHARISGKGYLPLENRIYESYARCYSALKQAGQYQYYSKKYLDTKTQLDANKKEGIRYLLKLVDIREKQNFLNKKNEEDRRTTIIIAAVVLLLVSLLMYYLLIRSKTADLKKQIDFFENQKKISTRNHFTVREEKAMLQTDEDKNERKAASISREKEGEILEKLLDFEQSDRFLNKNMSLATLAGQMETNTRYLSEVINKYKGKNFNVYINELRINHIAFMLKNNPTYLNYKVSYLAESCGFSSHSSFTTVFKSITGMSPNAYIQQIQKKHQ